MRISSRVIVPSLGIGLCALSLPAWSQKKSKPAPEFPEEIHNYQSWKQVARERVEMAPAVAMMCAPAGPIPIERPDAKGTEGPHAKKFLRVYVNEIGEAQMAEQKYPRFPVGTIIVKQKLPVIPSKNSKTGTPKPQQISSTPELLTVMLKREAGYNPSNGDWEFMVTNGAGDEVTERGKLKNCQSCHLPYAKTDYIVRSYLPKEVQAALKDLDATTNPKPN
ncbi:hypothetical protein EON83_10320 [bacterium]|nr:MAG: hypothetical protein EON83_10320 [bacterium]